MKKTHSTGSGQIRIIGGQWRGRKLPVPDSPGLRPTTDRVRETLFNWLAPDIVDARCLDCFAGSGALGLEALSRYAASATLLEMDRSVARQLQLNLATLKASQGDVVNTNTLTFLARPGQAHNIVFVDPPFRKGLLEETLRLLEQQGWLAQDALIYIESEVENGLPPTPANWSLHREKVAGQVAYRLYRRETQGAGNADH
ncbi:16S rRNA (guanine(966)-N(2))-methyltransferase [Shimwellia blattae]|uniref:Ribosomal RNA small subunit methyltransferase D n=1 Tax=Shimwellia blattae (strain ATCC 29907 / DSM 4481 / JCM 1650 / NBRC 105725 / CDC 9005-74) TaxID=630626 RepID=I2B463_SHIBC|nr:16S rRNA (guanine(966)-N(2))-methyltransferase [Shimwellia blattae]AFJ45317.1 putative methylase YhhF [Shimwellia blattae DSM 4481 = NBRC 105725]GAB80570.1 16S rRNA methyltransferase RsmD [Shimwellia blattae DSM 4481 = NBRC 105725]VDY62798.1 Ribosomal RNA small subunit methyltransferase D [Shimwellia blattae]VEC19653.1 Ribosomal RNA small subunit methyltransferase D [Shimwellia blattae]